MEISIALMIMVVIYTVIISVYVLILIQKKSNGIYNKPLYEANKEANELHEKLIIILLRVLNSYYS